MALRPETKEIDGTTFEIRGLDLRTERATFVRLTKVLGPALAELTRGGGAQGTAGALKAFVAALDEAELENLCKTFYGVTSVVLDGGAKVPCNDGVFKNGFSSQMKWLWFCLENQYSGLLKDTGSLAALFPGLLKKAASE